MNDPLLPPEVTSAVANILRTACTKENNYTYRTFVKIGDLNYKITFLLQDVDPIKEAFMSTIIIRRED